MSKHNCTFSFDFCCNRHNITSAFGWRVDTETDGHCGLSPVTCQRFGNAIRRCCCCCRCCRSWQEQKSMHATHTMDEVGVRQRKSHVAEFRKRFAFCDACNIIGAVNGIFNFILDRSKANVYVTTAASLWWMKCHVAQYLRFEKDRKTRRMREKEHIRTYHTPCLSTISSAISIQEHFIHLVFFSRLSLLDYLFLFSITKCISRLSHTPPRHLCIRFSISLRLSASKEYTNARHTSKCIASMNAIDDLRQRRQYIYSMKGIFLMYARPSHSHASSKAANENPSHENKTRARRWKIMSQQESELVLDPIEVHSNSILHDFTRQR